jgi:DNA-binding NarL/FixJ family response regulator
VLLADEPSLIGVGIRATLTGEKSFILVGEANDIDQIQELNRKLKPDLLIIDLDLPNFKLPDSITSLQKQCPNLKILALATQEHINTSILKGCGIAGWLLKSQKPQTLVSAICAVAQGYTWHNQSSADKVLSIQVSHSSCTEKLTLTGRERQVLRMLAQGFDNVHIATELHLGHQTVRNYISQIYTKLAVSSRTEAVIWAMKHNTVLYG